MGGFGEFFWFFFLPMVTGFCCSVHMFSSSFLVSKDIVTFGGWLCSQLWPDGVKWIEASLLIQRLKSLTCI